MKTKIKIPLKLKLFLPVSLIIIIVVLVSTIIFINRSISGFDNHIKSTLELEVKTIAKMFERESILKMDKVQTNLKVAHKLFYQFPISVSKDSVQVNIENQESGTVQSVYLKKWTRDNIELNSSNDFVNEMEKLFGGTISVFQKSDSGFVRISTNVRMPDGELATGTYIPNESPVVQAILRNETYFGRAIVVDTWYTTAYEPIIIDGEIAGILYVGDKEKDLSELKVILNTLHIGKSGFPFVFDKNGHILIHPELEGQDWPECSFFGEIKGKKEGIIDYEHNGQRKTVAYIYFEKFELYIATTIDKDIENKELVNEAIISAIVVGITAILLLLFLIYRFTTEKLYKYFNALQISNQKLASAENALKRAEKLANMGQISAGIAHELNNPLGVITMYSNIVLDELPAEDPLREDMQIIVTQAERCKNIVGGLLNFARKNKLKVVETEMVEFMRNSLNSVVIPDSITTSIKSELSDNYAMIDPEQMMQVFTNLEKNAVEAMPEGGHLDVLIKGNSKEIEILLSDTGCGIPEENMDKLFTPFFTTKEIGKGTGLGLALVYGIIKMHRGKITIESNTDIKKANTGTTFKIVLPRIN
jgi:signal transduction histidine kinase